jgi:hypothetical protein
VTNLLTRMQALVDGGEVHLSAHGFRELAADGILLDEVTGGIRAATVVEEYSEFAKGPSILVLQWDRMGRPLHVLWGIPKGHESPAVIVTAYRPDPGRWSEDFMRRRKP